MSPLLGFTYPYSLQYNYVISANYAYFQKIKPDGKLFTHFLKLKLFSHVAKASSEFGAVRQANVWRLSRNLPYKTVLRTSSTSFGFQNPSECSYEKVARAGLITNRCSGNEPAFSFVSFLLGKIEEETQENRRKPNLGGLTQLSISYRYTTSYQLS